MNLKKDYLQLMHCYKEHILVGFLINRSVGPANQNREMDFLQILHHQKTSAPHMNETPRDTLNKCYPKALVKHMPVGTTVPSILKCHGEVLLFKFPYKGKCL
ncbi:hypothetical protein AMECASPLE_034633 [Ameca splendens]|uniref:Uncharacterized protein n=1 Tax=Ameca splendens TaxID=208324 RepID=A0ABV0Z552_9TELE